MSSCIKKKSLKITNHSPNTLHYKDIHATDYKKQQPHNRASNPKKNATKNYLAATASCTNTLAPAKHQC